MIRSRTLAALTSCVLAVAACGGGDDAADAPDDDTTADATPTTVDTPAVTVAPAEPCVPPSDDSAPPPTISPEIPEPFLEGIGPVAVLGDSLPAMPEENAADPAVGQCAPVLVGENYAGDVVRLDAAVDGPTWLVFLAHWCPHCNDEIPVINELRDDGRLPDGLNVVGISTVANPDRPNWPPGEWLSEKDWTFASMADGIDVEAETFIAADAFGVSAFPFSVLIDENGRVANRWAGGRSAEELVSLLTGGFALGA